MKKKKEQCVCAAVFIFFLLLLFLRRRNEKNYEGGIGGTAVGTNEGTVDVVGTELFIVLCVVVPDFPSIFLLNVSSLSFKISIKKSYIPVLFTVSCTSSLVKLLRAFAPVK